MNRTGPFKHGWSGLLTFLVVDTTFLVSVSPNADWVWRDTIWFSFWVYIGR